MVSSMRQSRTGRLSRPGSGILLGTVLAVGVAALSPRALPAQPADAEAEPDGAAPVADHHMHVWSGDARDALVRLLAERRGGKPPTLPVFDGGDAVARLDSAGIPTGVLLSTAYFFGSPDVDFADERRKTRAENDWVARQAGEFPDRLLAFFSVNPLTGYASGEVQHCARTPVCGGMKLHLANADFDFRDSTHVDRLRSFFRSCQAERLPVVIHLQTRNEDFGGEEVRVFVDRVLPAAPEIPVQVAHMGGNSRFDSATVRAFDALSRAIRDHPERMDDVYFDMALVPFPPQRARGDTARQNLYRRWNRRFAEAVREVGAERIVFGTDYPEARPGPYSRRLRQSLPLADSTILELYQNRAPYLR